MTRLTRFSPLLPSVLGFDSFFDEFERMLDTSNSTLNSGFPPLNVFKEDSGDYVIELAVAGFKKEDIEVSHNKKRNLLTINGNTSNRVNKDNSDTEEQESSSSKRPKTDLIKTNKVPSLSPSRLTLKQGIATRRFSKAFTIADNLEVGEAALEDGMLTIHLKKIDSPDEQPLLITVK